MLAAHRMTIGLTVNTWAILIRLHVDTWHLKIRPMAIYVAAYETMLILKTAESKSGGPAIRNLAPQSLHTYVPQDYLDHQKDTLRLQDMFSIAFGASETSVIDAPTSRPLLQSIDSNTPKHSSTSQTAQCERSWMS